MRNEILQLIDRLLSEDRIKSPVLDVGGADLEYQKAQGYNFRSLFESKNIEYDIVDINNGVGVNYNCDFTDTILPLRYNTIFCLEMLEHTSNPVKIINNCHTHLKNKGLILVTVPDIYRQHCERDFWRFTENGLRELCKMFKIQEFGHFGKEEKGNYEHYFIGVKE